MTAYYFFLALLSAIILGHAWASYRFTREWFYCGAIFASSFCVVFALALMAT